MRQQPVVVLRQRLVEDVADEERRDDAEERREADQREHGAEPQAVRLKRIGDAAQVRAPHGRVGRPLRFLAGPHGATLAARSGLNEPRYGSTVKVSIIPLSWCSAMWQ